MILEEKITDYWEKKPVPMPFFPPTNLTRDWRDDVSRRRLSRYFGTSGKTNPVTVSHPRPPAPVMYHSSI